MILIFYICLHLENCWRNNCVYNIKTTICCLWLYCASISLLNDFFYTNSRKRHGRKNIINMHGLLAAYNFFIYITHTHMVTPQISKCGDRSGWLNAKDVVRLALWIHVQNCIILTIHNSEITYQGIITLTFCITISF